MIVADRVTHHYNQGGLSKRVLLDISATIMPGEIVILTGPSGSGKTTLLTLAGALRSVQQGSMKVLGIELNGADADTLVRIRENIGFIFQSHGLINALTARQNVEMGLGLERSLSRAESSRRALEMLAAVGLAGHADSLPARLSGGQRQRVAIARALVRNPKLVLADEPTASLDRKSGREVVEILQNLARRQGCAILLVTHDNRILDLADRIMRLEDGELKSLEEGIAENSGFLLGALAKRLKRGDFMEHIASFSNQGFVEMLEQITGEFEQYLKITQLGTHDAMEALTDHVLYAVGERLRLMLHAERCTIFVVGSEPGELYLKVVTGGGDNALQLWTSIQTKIAEQVAISGQSENLEDPYLHPLFDRALDENAGYRTRSLLCIPIFNRKQKLFAVAQLVNKQDASAFGPKDEEEFEEFAKLFSVVLEGSIRMNA